MLFQRFVVIQISKARDIKPGDPHIDYNDDMEVGFFLLKCGIQLLGAFVVFHAAEVVIHSRLIVAADTGYHSHERHWLHGIQFFLSGSSAVRHLLFDKPFRVFLLEFQQQVIGDLSVGAYHHCFLNPVRLFFAGGCIVVVNIHGKAFQAGRLSENDLHRTHRLFTCFNILLGCTIVRTGFVVAFDLLDLFRIQQNLCYSRMILDGYRQPIGNGLIHGIAVDLIAKGLVGFRNRSTRKTDKGSMRERLFQHFCIRLGNHSFHILISIFTELDFSRMLQLGSVCLIREADNIVAVIDKTDLIFLAVTEFLNRADIEPATFSGTEFLPQMLSVLHHRNITEIQELLALGKQLDTLLLQFLTVNDHDDGGRTDLRNVTAAERKLSGKERHRIGLAAPGCAEVGAALACLLHDRFYDTLFEQSCCKELRVTADDFPFIAVENLILKIDIVAEDFQKAFRRIDTAHHGFGFLKRHGGQLVPIVHTPPCIEMLIRSTHGSQSGFYTVRNTRQWAIVQ